MRQEPATGHADGAFGSFAIVTPTHNRLPLLKRLYDSLCAQTRLDFTWVVVDDASTDRTRYWVETVTRTSPFDIILIENHENIGKAASLNRAFAQVHADFSAIVDSDDQLVPTGVAVMSRKALQYAGRDEVGAIFFSYIDAGGNSLRGDGPASDVVMTRVRHDHVYRKYDGCVGYFRRVTSAYRYPEFDGETYVGPTVLQLLMAPDFKIAFCPETVGVAEYQPTGLTAAGRILRVQNPLGMMAYTKLIAEQSPSWRERAKNAAMNEAYYRIAVKSGKPAQAQRVRPVLLGQAYKFLGQCLAVYWSRAHLR